LKQAVLVKPDGFLEFYWERRARATSGILKHPLDSTRLTLHFALLSIISRNRNSSWRMSTNSKDIFMISRCRTYFDQKKGGVRFHPSVDTHASRFMERTTPERLTVWLREEGRFLKLLFHIKISGVCLRIVARIASFCFSGLLVLGS